jgi:hypothetical protein
LKVKDDNYVGSYLFIKTSNVTEHY